QKLSDIGVVNYDGSGGFTFNYTVKALSYMSGAGQIDCAKVACVIGTTNGNNPADQSYASVAPITVAAPVAAAPGKAKITTAKQKGKKNVLLKWKAAKAHGTPVTKYKVEVKQKKAKKGWKSWKKAGTTDKTKLKWKNGKKGHVYKFRVVAKSKAGDSTSKVVKVKIKK
ncbi:MAG TPA: fibronectin type III domain-containing protein, partial [Candidatus Nanopelagicales bacterium]|nr:fibronectin type III domain-containing protein [Candidatus Nanopelagicales bacterium]